MSVIEMVKGYATELGIMSPVQGAERVEPAPVWTHETTIPAEVAGQWREGLNAEQWDQLRARESRVTKFLKFKGLADHMATLSKDPSTKVGAVALDDQYNVVVAGYNGFPRGVVDSDERYLDREIKYRLVSHAESNLVAQAAYVGVSLQGCTVLVTSLFPCSNCAKMLIQAGVMRVIAQLTENPRWTDEQKWSKILFDESSVEVIYVKEVDRPDGQKVWEVAGNPP